jgi:hypothetical protein
MNNEWWGWRCMLQLQEAENWTKLATTTWAAEFLLREGESRECLGSWINSSVVHEAKKRRAKQVITCSFPCWKWLHIIGARPSPGCELCKRERGMATTSTNALPIETVGHIQSVGCKAQKKSVHLWEGTRIDDILPWDEIEDEVEKLLERVDQDETDPYNEVIFGRRRPDSVAIDWTSTTLYVLEFKRT